MKNRVLTTMALATSLMVTAAYAQSSQLVRADIPFDFRVGQKLLPAGTYTVEAKSAGQAMVLVRSLDCKEAVIVLFNPVQTNRAPAEGKLVFQRYGNAYFLSQVWHSGEDRGIQLQKSKAEREMAKRLQPSVLASIVASKR